MIQLRLKNISVVLSLVIILIVFVLPDTSFEAVTWVSLFLFVLLGIPHGANDHFLYKFCSKKTENKYFIAFLFKYIFLSILFYFVWYLIPWLALTIFLMVSAYHFGQANWNQVDVGKGFKNAIYLSWGGFVLAGSLLLNFGETQPIVESLIGFELNLSNSFTRLTPIVFLISTITIASYFLIKEKLSLKEFFTEITSLSALSLLFLFTPLLVGFSCFFVLWHSTVSIADQIEAFQEKNSNFSIKDYLMLAAPMSLLAFIFLGAGLYFSAAQPISDQWIGAFFKFISIITLPHTYLMDRLLEDAAPEKVQPLFPDLNFPQKILLKSKIKTTLNNFF